ncbi:MAG: methyltransferase domain-containing protein [Candidatus Cloacimonetes bacterium]|nr:methyltransferase domain-containing protein [Candidatus Cloacimonadota bacterium]
MIRDKLIQATPHICKLTTGYKFANLLRGTVHRQQKMLSPFITQEMKVMDIGCGDGYFTLPVARLLTGEGCVYAVDVQQEMLDVITAKAIRKKLTKKIKTKLIDDVVFEMPEQLDFILAFFMLHEVPDIPVFLKTLHKLMAPEGRLFIAEPNHHVMAEFFNKEIEAAQLAGWKLEKQISIFMGKAALFKR